MTNREDSLPGGFGRLHDEIIGRYAQLREERLLSSLPEACQKECSIARWVVHQAMSNPLFDEDTVYSRLSECQGKPRIVDVPGTCTKRTVCEHPGSGDTASFDIQTASLADYLQT